MQVKNGMETARLNLEMAQRSYERTKTLLDTKVVTQSQLDDAQTKLDLAKTAFDNANRQYQTVTGSGLAQAEAQVNFIKVQISNSTITSPISGIVTNRNINPGEITSTSTALLSIADVATLKLQGNVSQEDVVRIPVGGKGERGRGRAAHEQLRGPGRAGRAHRGSHRAVLPRRGEPEERREASCRHDGQGVLHLDRRRRDPDPPERGAGQPGWARQRLRADRGPGARAECRPGSRSDSEVQVISGLSASDSVAISNVSALVDGMEVAQ